MRKIAVTATLVLAAILFFVLKPTDTDPTSLEPVADERCPVCGMFVAKYPNWVAQVSFDDDTTAFFDGPKDMFKYLFNLKKYVPTKSREDVAAIFVTEYYDLKPIKAADVFFVKGSDVLGPMGHELVPFVSQNDAQEFLKDHNGKVILSFAEISPEVIDELN